jgi:hypothetical protein
VNRNGGDLDVELHHQPPSGECRVVRHMPEQLLKDHSTGDVMVTAKVWR